MARRKVGERILNAPFVRILPMRGYYAYGTHMNFPKFEYLRDGMAPACVVSLSYVLFLECAAGYVCTKYPLTVRRDRTCQRSA